jgi:hypothetical protein
MQGGEQIVPVKIVVQREKEDEYNLVNLVTGECAVRQGGQTTVEASFRRLCVPLGRVCVPLLTAVRP